MSRHILDMPNEVTVSWVTSKLAWWTIMTEKKRHEFWVSNLRTLYAFHSSQLSLFMHTNKNIWWEKIGFNNNGQNCCFVLYIKADVEKTNCSELQHMQDETKFTHKLSTVSLFVKNQVKNIIQHMSCNAQFKRSTSPSNEVTYSSAVSLVMTIYSTLLGVLTQWTAGVSNHQMLMEYTHDEYCDMLLFPGTAAWEYALHWPGQHQPVTNVFHWLEKCLCETGKVAPMAYINSGCPQTVQTLTNEDVVTADMEWGPRRSSRYYMRIGTNYTEGPGSTSWQSIASTPLLTECTSVSRRSSSTDAILWMATTSTNWGWLICM